MGKPQLFDEQSYLRLRGIARAVCYQFGLPPDQADDLAQQAAVKLEANFRRDVADLREHRLKAAHLRKVVQNQIIDLLRRKGANPGPVPDGLPAPQKPAADAPPLCVVEKRIQLAFADRSEVHELLAYGYIALLGWKPQEVVEKLSNCTLDSAATEFVDEYGETSHVPKSRLTQLFAVILSSPAGGRCFPDYWDEEPPARKCAHWVLAVKKRLRSRIYKQEECGLEQIVQAVSEPWKTLCFLEIFIMKTRAGDVPCNATTDDALEALTRRYHQSWRADAPQEPTVRAWFRPLSEQIARAHVGKKKLLDFVVHDGRYAGDNAHLLSIWRADVLQSIRHRFGCQHGDTLIFAWRVGLVR